MANALEVFKPSNRRVKAGKKKVANVRSDVMDARVIQLPRYHPDESPMFSVKVRYVRFDGAVRHEQHRFKALEDARVFARTVTGNRTRKDN